MIGYTLWTMLWLGSVVVIFAGTLHIGDRHPVLAVIWAVITVSLFIGMLLWRIDESGHCGDTVTRDGVVTVTICR